MLLSSFKAPIHCCSIEVTSLPSQNDTECFTCGMYELNEDTHTRKGAVAICNKDGIAHCVDTDAGVLDMKYKGNLLACALSNGHIALYSQSDSTLTHIKTYESSRDAGLALSLCWDSVGSSDSCNGNVAVSYEHGCVAVYTVDSSGLREVICIQDAHCMFGEHVPAWITAFSPHNPELLVSGGDDLYLKLWDTRCPVSPVHASAKHYTAGITSAQWNPSLSYAHLLAVGSYDGSVRIWDDRYMGSPLHEQETAGGVWRVKWKLLDDMHRNRGKSFLATACMHGGASLYEYSDENGLEQVSALVDDNTDRLTYGMDWLKLQCCQDISSDEEKLLWSVATCSFYDNTIQIWGNSVN
mmetsp:Transcript_16153/g.24347  ORF Transcript_16153/g.24347 Transcript_16153/m.24347 type:complete len:354 (-) Transcript_16153:308-1369(-)